MRFLILYPFKYPNCNFTLDVSRVRRTLWFNVDGGVTNFSLPGNRGIAGLNEYGYQGRFLSSG